MSKIVIDANNVSKRYQIGTLGSSNLREMLSNIIKFKSRSKSSSKGEFWALKDVSFQVSEGEAVGIIGRNGAGKSTLLKVLSKITEPTAGRIAINGRLASLLEVGTGFHPELTGRENIYLNGSILGMTRREITIKLDEIIAFSGIEQFIDTPVKRYSSGMYVRLAFAVAAHLEPEIMVVDEVLAVGDAEFQKKCLGKMNEVAEGGRTILFVSHDMSAIKRLCSKGIYLDKGQVQAIGPIGEVVDSYLSNNMSNTRDYDSGIVSSVSIWQEEGTLILELEYETDVEMYLPCLGFVVSTLDSMPIFGHNPKLSATPPSMGGYAKKGKVRAMVTEPKLLDGEYWVSIWFGDGYKDYFVEKECLRLEVAGMTLNKQKTASTVGPVAPTCQYEFL